MEKQKISLEQAEKEWIEFLEENDATSLIPNENLKAEDKAAYDSAKSNFEKIIKAISRGDVVIEDGIVTQNLRFPVKTKENDVLFDKLCFDQRWTAKDRQDIYRDLNPSKPDEAMKIQQRLCAKITGQDNMRLGLIDSRDLKVTDQIVSVFFM